MASCSDAAGPFVLEPDQALIMEGTIPSCRFANVVLWNRFLQSFEYRFGERISLHQGQMRLNSNRYFIVLSASNPIPARGREGDSHRSDSVNAVWMTTQGRERGTIFWRFVLPDGSIDTPRTTVVQTDDVMDYLAEVNKRETL